MELHLWNAERPALVDDERSDLARFRWRLDARGYVIRHCELIRWRVNERGERVKTVLYKQKLSHAAMGEPPRGFVWDHISRDRLDNRARNLRLISLAANAQNRSAHKCNVTGLRGVFLRKDTKRYLAHASVGGVAHRLGYYDTPEEAAAVARKFRLEHMPYTVEV